MRTTDAFRAAEDYAASIAVDVQLDPHVQHLLGDANSIHGQQQYRGLSVYPHSIPLTAVNRHYFKPRSLRGKKAGVGR